MLKALKFVKGAIAKKDFQPALTHFRIAHGRVTGYNGTVALSGPINLDLVATPKATPFIKAIERCTSETTAIHMTPAGHLSIKSGTFKAIIDCSKESEVLDSIVPEGDSIPLESGFLQAIKTLMPFVGTDASRPWSMGILLRGASAYATNNIILVEYWIGSDMPDINLPASAVNELARIGELPIDVKLGDRSVTFFFEGDRWMRSQLLSTEWPDITALLNRAFEGKEFASFPEGMFDAIETLAPFVDIEGRVYFREGCMLTTPTDAAGASIEIEGLPSTGAFNHKYLASLQGVAELIDLTKHPQACPFIGDKVRGVIVGMHDV